MSENSTALEVKSERLQSHSQYIRTSPSSSVRLHMHFAPLLHSPCEQHDIHARVHVWTLEEGYYCSKTLHLTRLLYTRWSTNRARNMLVTLSHKVQTDVATYRRLAAQTYTDSDVGMRALENRSPAIAMIDRRQ